MPATTAARNTPVIDPPRFRTIPLAAGAKINKGAMVQINAAGFAVPATATAANVAIGRAEETVDNTSGAAGDQRVKVRRGVFRFGNSTSADLIGRTEIGKQVFVVDDQTVAKTSNSNARPAAGTCFDVDAVGVWVDFV